MLRHSCRILIVHPKRGTLFCHGVLAPDLSSIPKIASIGKVQIGYSAQEDLARKWGEGKAIIGGHSNSPRAWRIVGTRWRVNTDGFDYSRGLVVDQFTLGTYSDASGDIPYAKLSKSDFFCEPMRELFPLYESTTAPDHCRFWFAEIKGPVDKLREAQKLSHEAIRVKLGVRVELIGVVAGATRRRTFVI